MENNKKNKTTKNNTKKEVKQTKTKNDIVKNKQIQSNNEGITKGLIAQLISLIVLIILVVGVMFNRNILPYADLVAAVTFFIIAFNKKKQNKIIPIGCIIGGLFFTAIAIWGLING